MKRILYIIGITVGIVFLWLCGFWTGRITAPVQPAKVIYVKSRPAAMPAARTKAKKERTIYTSKRGKKYYLTPAGNKVYIKDQTGA